jgi:hypothetical protein
MLFSFLSKAQANMCSKDDDPSSSTSVTSSTSPTPSSSSSPTPESGSHKPPLAAIIGGVVGGLLGLTICQFGVVIWYLRRKRRKMDYRDETPTRTRGQPPFPEPYPQVQPPLQPQMTVADYNTYIPPPQYAAHNSPGPFVRSSETPYEGVARGLPDSWAGMLQSPAPTLMPPRTSLGREIRDVKARMGSKPLPEPPKGRQPAVINDRPH